MYFGIGRSLIEARALSDRFDAYFDDVIARLDRATDAERAEIVEAGGWEKFAKLQAQTQAHDLKAKRLLEGLSELDLSGIDWEPERDVESEYTSPPAKKRQRPYTALPKVEAALIERGAFRKPTAPTEDEPDFESEAEVLQVKARRAAKDLAAKIEKRRKLMPVSGRSLHGLHGLVDLAAKVSPQGAKSIQRTHLYVDRFIKHLGGDRLPNTVTQTDAVSWRNALADEGKSGVNQEQHLAKMKAIFSHAVSEGKLTANPFAGVKARFKLEEKKASRKKRAFTDEELGKFLSAARTFDDQFYAITLCIMFTGAGSGEICGLRVKDVRTEDGVWVFDFNDEARQLKTEFRPRLVPITRLLMSRVMKLVKGRSGDAPLFEGLPQRLGGPAHKVQNDASGLIRAHVTRDKRLTYYCLRHTWRQRARRLKVDGYASRAVLGHEKGEDIHDIVYGEVPDVKELSRAVEAVAKDTVLKTKLRKHT